MAPGIWPTLRRMTKATSLSALPYPKFECCPRPWFASRGHEEFYRVAGVPHPNGTPATALRFLLVCLPLSSRNESGQLRLGTARSMPVGTGYSSHTIELLATLLVTGRFRIQFCNEGTASPQALASTVAKHSLRWFSRGCRTGVERATISSKPPSCFREPSGRQTNRNHQYPQASRTVAPRKPPEGMRRTPRDCKCLRTGCDRAHYLDATRVAYQPSTPAHLAIVQLSVVRIV
jgi:hypothetical protein